MCQSFNPVVSHAPLPGLIFYKNSVLSIEERGITMRSSRRKRNRTDDFDEEELLEEYMELSGEDPSEDLLETLTRRFNGDRIRALQFLIQGELRTPLIQ